MGNVGAGTGASVGKLGGIQTAMKSGLGMYAVQLGDLKIGAIVAVMRLGDVYDYKTGKRLAGMRTNDGKDWADSEQVLYNSITRKKICSIKTRPSEPLLLMQSLTKPHMNKIAAMAQNGYARSIRPVHTTADGDSIYALSVGEIEADLNVTGTLAAQVMGRSN